MNEPINLDRLDPGTLLVAAVVAWSILAVVVWFERRTSDVSATLGEHEGNHHRHPVRRALHRWRGLRRRVARALDRARTSRRGVPLVPGHGESVSVHRATLNGPTR